MENKKVKLLHYSRTYEHPKIEKMLSELGWEGYGLYWGMLELLNYYPSDCVCNLQCDYDYLSEILDADKKILRQLVEKFDLFNIEPRIYETELEWEEN
jgi:hypothetical protein